jgi:hypothetical protein
MRIPSTLLALILGFGMYFVGPIVTKFEPFKAAPVQAQTYDDGGDADQDDSGDGSDGYGGDGYGGEGGDGGDSGDGGPDDSDPGDEDNGFDESIDA